MNKLSYLNLSFAVFSSSERLNMMLLTKYLTETELVLYAMLYPVCCYEKIMFWFSIQFFLKKNDYLMQKFVWYFGPSLEEPWTKSLIICLFLLFDSHYNKFLDKNILRYWIIKMLLFWSNVQKTLLLFTAWINKWVTH